MSRALLCAIDFSEASREAMHVAADLARNRHAALELVHVVDRPLWANEPYLHLPGDVRQQALDALERDLEAWRREAEQRARAKVAARTVSGAAWDQIVALARADASIDTIVVGSHGRSALSRAVLGSVAERVVRHAPCSVLVVPPRLHP